MILQEYYIQKKEKINEIINSGCPSEEKIEVDLV